MRQPVRFLASLLAGLALAATPAPAEDFSGFYAGVNAGYAFDRSARDGRSNGRSTSTPSPSVRDEDRLPPSAAGSALATRRDRIGEPAPRPR